MDDLYLYTLHIEHTRVAAVSEPTDTILIFHSWPVSEGAVTMNTAAIPDAVCVVAI